ncbi:ABC transporter ATP-binding protein [Roseomonas sp. NAR14]|uniref:ABC transporter ATP-binding protein n=1 Tax=Roseomonas acroporae TaxID=2937791 RepID=A0A9X2BZI5_9PROT|nr:ABC transporter ATP-binding protein [Roseomonas acroporae]MCK8787065.1 ABC transporter ATP-binding protein [Roseomonas acroporae]
MAATALAADAAADTLDPAAAAERPPVLEIASLRKSFGSMLALDRCDLTLRQGEIVALLGASGCGKSTLLNIIAGFETADFGTLRLRGALLNKVPPHRRNIAMVFQSYALFPHMTVAGNIAYGLEVRGLGKAEMASRVAEMVGILRLQGLEGRYPQQLSGGQRQRVAVARALAIRPDMLLLDEAFSALDKNLREETQLELSLLLRRLDVTTILVTHDQREAFALADRVAVMHAGRIAQIGTPEQVYRHPATDQVLRFLGSANTLRGTARAGEIRLAEGLGYALPPGRTVPEGPVSVLFRTEDAGVSTVPTAIHRAHPARVTLSTFFGAQERVVLDLDGQQVVVDRPVRSADPLASLPAGSAVFLDLDPERCRLEAG